MPEALLEEGRQRLERARFRVPIDVAEEIFDEELAPEPLAEELDVGADDRPEVEEYRRVLLCEVGEELGKALRHHDGLVAHCRDVVAPWPIGAYRAPLQDV